MSGRDSPFSAELEEAIFKPRRELVDEPRDEALKLLAQSDAAGTKLPWSKYVPFPTGTELDIKGSAILPFSGTGRVDERTDDKLALSFSVDVPGLGAVGARVEITYNEEGSRNRTIFSIFTTAQTGDQATHIKSTRNERILTPIGGLDIRTNVAFPDKVTVKVVHLRPKEDRVELEAEFAGPIPNAIIQASRKPAAGKK